MFSTGWWQPKGVLTPFGTARLKCLCLFIPKHLGTGGHDPVPTFQMKPPAENEITCSSQVLDQWGSLREHSGTYLWKYKVWAALLVGLFHCICPAYHPLKLNLVFPFKEKEKSCFHTINKPLEQTSFLLALPKAPHAASFVLFTHSLAWKEQQHPFFFLPRGCRTTFSACTKHSKALQRSSPSSSASPLNSCHVPPQNFPQLSKKHPTTKEPWHKNS